MPILGTFIVPHPPVIIPEVGDGREKDIQKTIDAYEEISRRIAELKPETIVVLTPHGVMYSDYMHISPGKSGQGNLARFGAPGVTIQANYDEEFVSALSFAATSSGISAGTLGENDKKLDHGIIVPLYFIEHNLTEYKLVRVSSSGLSREEHYALGRCLKQVTKELDRKVVIIASGDLSHKLTSDGPYTYAKEGPIFDEQITNAMAKADFLTFLTMDEELLCSAGECGLNPFVMMTGALDQVKVEAELLSYEGPFGVGYAVCAFKPLGVDQSRDFGLQAKNMEKIRLDRIKNQEDAFVSLARLSLETFVMEHRTLNLTKDLIHGHLINQSEQLQIKQSDALFKRRSGVFVTLKKDGRLRGCIGTIEPAEASIAEEIMRNAVSAGASDLRFSPVTKEELPDLVYSVDVLSPPESIVSKDELDVLRYGVIVKSGRKRGLLLPNLENVTCVDEQVSIALQKAGIPSDADYTMERFEVVRHH